MFYKNKFDNYILSAGAALTLYREISGGMYDSSKKKIPSCNPDTGVGYDSAKG